MTDDEWKAAYVAAFVAFALSRPWWTQENAEVCADEIADEALIGWRGDDPKRAAETDVIECEWESESDNG